MKDMYQKMMGICSVSLLLLLSACNGKVTRYDFDPDSEPFTTYEMAAFATRILSDPQTFYQDLREEAAALGIDTYSSPDNRIRVYTWICGGGSCPDYASITQFMNDKGQVLAQHGCPVPEDKDWGTIVGISQENGLSDRPIYFVHTFYRISGRDSYRHIVPVILEGDTFVQGPTFKDGDQTLETLCNEISLLGEGYGSLYMEKDGTYAPMVQGKRLQTYHSEEGSGHYETWSFDGKDFIHVFLGRPQALHPSLHDSQMMVYAFSTDSHLLRVDQLFDKTYRLALWNIREGVSTADMPDIVIHSLPEPEGGVENEFRQGNMTYQILDINTGEFRILRDGVLIHKSYRRSLMEEFDSTFELQRDQLLALLPKSSLPLSLDITEEHILFVYANSDGRLSYRSWDREGFEDFTTAPALALENGAIEGIHYRFSNGGYVYLVPRNDREPFQTSRDGKFLSREDILRRYTAFGK